MAQSKSAKNGMHRGVAYAELRVKPSSKTKAVVIYSLQAILPTMGVGNFVKQVAGFVLCVFVFNSSFSLPVFANSYDVTASIPFPIPTTAAVIDSSIDGSSVSMDIFEVFGTCDYVQPISVVSIWRGETLVGSVNCEVNGTFRVNISLISGVNQLVARTSNISGVYGPDSSVANVLLSALPSQQNPVLTQPTESTLVVTSPAPFVQLSEANSVSIQIIVGGGLRPYTIVVNWGDGTTETLQVDEPGTYTFQHVYTTAGVYKIVATTTDILGVSRVFQFIAAAALPANTQQAEIQVNELDSKLETQDDTGSANLTLYIGVIVWVLFLLVSTFLLGRRYQFRKMQAKLNELESALRERKSRRT